MIRKPRIVVVGSSNMDLSIHLERLPQPGETVLGGRFLRAAGGKGANQAVAAARAGAEVTFVARVGRDAFGDEAIAGFRQDNISVDHVRVDRAAPTGVALIFVAENGENSIAVAGGANDRLSPADVRRARRSIQDADALLLQLETPLESMEIAAAMAAKAGVPVILNPAPAGPLPESLLEQVTVLTPNEHEAGALTGIAIRDCSSAARAAAQLRARGAGAVIVTLGRRGAYISSARCKTLIGGFKVKAEDTVGAGDVFNGALAVALAEGCLLPEAVRFANAAAAISVTRSGAQASAPLRREVEEFLRQRG